MFFIGGLIKTGIGILAKKAGKILRRKPPARLPPRAPPPTRLPPRVPKVPPIITRGAGVAVTGAAVGSALIPRGNGAGVDKLGRPLLVQPETTQRIKCPPGYVAVTMPDGSRACALKGVARAAGLWRSRPKPPIKASEWRKLKTANRVEKKAKKIAQSAGFTCKRKRGGR